MTKFDDNEWVFLAAVVIGAILGISIAVLLFLLVGV